MGFLASLFRAGPPAHDDFWYRPAGGASLTGVRVDPDTAMKLSATWACVRLISETIATMPLGVYERSFDGSKRSAPEHPLFEVLHDQPNATQTALEWRQQMTVHALMRGNGYSKIVPGVRGSVDQLVPLHPDRVTEPDGPGQPFLYRAGSGLPEEIPTDRMFKLRGMMLDGSRAVSVIEYARESMGIGLAAEQYAGRVFSQDGRPRGTLEHPGKLSKDAADRLKETWQEAYAGLANAHKVAVLQEGMKFNAISVSPDDAQMIATREFSIEDVARWFGVPPHMIGSTAKVTSWGSGIEQLSIGFVTYTLLPWLKRWEQAVRRDLIGNKQRFFAEHNVDGLVRGDIQTRYGAYMTGRMGKWLSANDVRRLENMNPIGGGDVYENPAITVGPAGQQKAAQNVALDGPDWQAQMIELAAERTNGHA